MRDAGQWMNESDHFTTSRGHSIAYRRRGAGATVLMLHGFPTWSYDYAGVAADLESDHEVVTLDFLGYGLSDKPDPYDYSVTESADIVEELAAHLGLTSVHLVIHDYGSIVGQELLDRHRNGILPFGITSLAVFNCGLVYSEYRPTTTQKLLALPVVGRLIAGRITPERVRSGLDGVRGGEPLTDEEFANLWAGISRNDGQKLAYRLIRYNAERSQHHQRWEAAVSAYEGPVHLIWGMNDPVSGAHVLAKARQVLPNAQVTELDGVGHFPTEEAPERCARALRSHLDEH